MVDVPTQVILAAFKDEDGAENALKQLKAAQKEHLIKIENVAILRCDQQGKLAIKEPTDRGIAQGAVLGGAVGAVVGLLFPPLILATAAGGAAVGGVIAKLHDSGFDDNRLKELGKSLQPGTSAILAVIDHIWVVELEEELRKAGAQTVTEQLSSDIAEQLKAGHDVAYTAIMTDNAAVVARATSEPLPAGADGAQAALPTEASPATPAKSESAPASASEPASGTTPETAPSSASAEKAEPKST
jgi:uncharacterized membrane protein